MRQRARVGDGSTCKALIKFFEKNGYIEINLYPTTGAWRKKMFDVYLWEVHMKKEGDWLAHSYGCWESITSFLKNAKKYGFIISSDGSELWANEKEI